MSYKDLFTGKKIVASDLESTGLNFHGAYSDYGYYPAAPFAFSFTTYEGKNWYVRFQVDPYTRRVMYEKNLEGYFKLIEFYKRKDITTVWHNAAYDLSLLPRINISISGKVFDSMILSYLDNGSLPTALKPLCKKLFDIEETDQKELIDSVNKARRAGKKLGYCLAQKENGFGTHPNKADYWLGDPILCEKYAVTDTDRTMGLYYCFEEKYKTNKEYRDLVDMEHEIMYILMDMQDRGIRVDVERIKEIIPYYEKIIKKQELIKKDLGYEKLNPRSPNQMSEVFYTDLKLDPIYRRRKDKKTGDSKQTRTTDANALLIWSKKIPLAKCLIEISAAEHELNTFIKPFLENSIQFPEEKSLHPNYRSVGTVTGRTSCAKPNLLNISSNDSVKRKSETLYRARECFIPREGYYFLFFDYSQIEVWISAFLSNDRIMIEYLLAGGDLHAKTGEACFGHKEDYEGREKHYRKNGKTINFGSIYGMGAKALMDQIDCSYQEAETALFKFWDTYIGLDAYRNQLSDTIKLKGKVINPFGREYYMRPDSAYKSLNYMVQGSAAEVLKRAMININCFIKPLDAFMILNIYDEFVLEVKQSMCNKFFMRSIIKRMQAGLHEKFKMPKPFGVGVEISKTNWHEKKKVNI